MTPTPHAPCAYCTGPVDRRKDESRSAYLKRECCSVKCARRLAPQGVNKNKPPVEKAEPAPLPPEPNFRGHDIIFKDPR